MAINDSKENLSHSGPTRKRTFKTSIELPILINLIAINITGSSLSNVLLYKTCLQSLNYTQLECQAFLSPLKSNETLKLEEEVQEYLSLVISVRTVIAYIGPVILSLFMGVWSDTYGRKPLMVWSIFGMFMNAILSAVYSTVDSMGPWWYVVAAIPFSITGGYVIMFTGAYCYVSDISTSKDSSQRMALVDAAIPLGQFIGLMMTSYLILSIGHVCLLYIAAILNLIAFGYLHFFIKESLVEAKQGGALKVLNVTHVKKMFRECFKRRPNYERAQIMIASVVKAMSVLILYGIGILEYMYTRQKLKWALQEYNTYSSINTLISFAGGLFGVYVVQKWFKIGDIPFSILTLLTAIEEFMIKFSATTSLDMYRSSFIAMFKALLGPLLRSNLKKTLPREDIATVFAFMCTVETISPVIAPTIYNSLYAATLATFPGAIYLLSVALASIGLIMLCFVYNIQYNKGPLRFTSPITNDNLQTTEPHETL